MAQRTPIQGFVEVFERQERKAGCWVDAHCFPFTSDAEGTLLLPGIARDPLMGAPDVMCCNIGWTPVSNDLLVEAIAEFNPGVLVTRHCWLAEGGRNAEAGWQFAADWSSTFGNAVIGKLVGNSTVRRRRWLCPVCPEGRTAALLDQVPALLRPRIFVHLHSVRHLLLLVHGVGVHDAAKMQRKVSDMRCTRAVLARAGLPDTVAPAIGIGPSMSSDSPLAQTVSRSDGHIDVFPVSWHDGGPGPVAEAASALDRISLTGTQTVRDFVQNTMMNAALYLGGFRSAIEDTVAGTLNNAFICFVVAHPGFSGQSELIDALILQKTPLESIPVPQVSLFAHSLGSVIAFDLLCHRGSETSPQLRFTPAAIFAVGSPIGFYLTLRNEGPEETRRIMSRFLRRDGSVCSIRLINIIHPKDPIAFLLAPLLSRLSSDAVPRPPRTVSSYKSAASKGLHDKAIKLLCATRAQATAFRGRNLSGRVVASPELLLGGASESDPIDTSASCRTGHGGPSHSGSEQSARNTFDGAPVEIGEDRPGVPHKHFGTDDDSIDFVLPAEFSPRSIISAAMGPLLGDFLLALQGHKSYWTSPDCLEFITQRILEMEAESIQGKHRYMTEETSCSKIDASSDG